MTEAVHFTSPVGRLIMGDAFTGSDKDHQGRPRLDQQGRPKTQFFIGVAYRKDDPAWGQMWAAIHAQGVACFPGGEHQRPDFAWKVVDGDTKYPDRPECKGHYIVRFSSGFPPSVFDENNLQIADGTLGKPKRGDFVQVHMSVNGNGDRMKPGVYVNHSMVKFVGFGEAISSGPSAEETFGSAPVALPPGASAYPTAPSAGMPAAPAPALAPAPAAPAPAYPAAPAPAAPAPAAPAPAAPAPAAPAPAAPAPAYPAGVQPAPDFLNGPQ